MSMADYVPGGNFGSYPSQFAGECADKCVCEALDIGLETITEALYTIDSTLERKLGQECELVDKCKDEIINLIDEHFRYPTKTCEECQAAIDAGLSGTLEFAVSCAASCVEDHHKECQSASDDGLPCSNCGEYPCCCDQGECVPCDFEDEDKPKKYVGYCNRATGAYSVTKQGDSNPDPLAIPVSLADTEEAALQEAAEFCSSYGPKTPPPQQIPQVNEPVGQFQFCDIEWYKNKAYTQTLISWGETAFSWAGIAQQVQAIGQVGLAGVSLDSVGQVLYSAFSTQLNLPPAMAALLTEPVAKALGCNDPVWINGMQVIAALGYLERTAGVDFTPYATSIEYAINSACRRKFLSPPEAMAAFLANAIDITSLDTHWAIAGYCPSSVNETIETQRSKPLPIQLAMLRRRSLIGDTQYFAGMRQLGYLDEGVSRDLFTITEQIPTLSDIIHLMVRDADDEKLVQQFGLDTAFTEKYQKQLRNWSEWQGVTETVARYNWRAHWTIPSPGQLFTFYHRLRNDPAFNKQRPLLDDIKAALIQQDILPYWHEHFLATSFLPLGRIDIRRAYNIGALDDKEAVAAYKQLGYSDANAEQLLKFAKRLREIAAQGHKAVKLWVKFRLTLVAAKARMKADGLPDDVIDKAFLDAEPSFASSPYALAFTRGDLSRDELTGILSGHGVSAEGIASIADTLAYKITSSPHIRSYVSGLLSRQEASGRMLNDGMQSAIITRLLREADEHIESDLIRECISGIKHRYLHGELSRDECHNLLVKRNVPLERVNQIMSGFECTKSAQGRQVPVEKLCHWLYLGMITQDEFMQRLLRLGYTDENASLLLFDCVQANTLRSIKEARKIQREQEQTADRQRRAIQRANTAIERDRERMNKLRQRQAKLRSDRDVQLLTSAERIAKAAKVELTVAYQAAKDRLHYAMSECHLPIDEALKIIVIASSNMKDSGLEYFATQVSELCSAAESSGLQPSISEVAGEPSSNGSTQPSG